ncbi:hypothetical protein BGZ57DRAFT_826094 [Hyaloscypha finlandica]|nr:hypothetical protein BGZ57DRAFT_826094 [Hyaloscypha finlandica]
MADISIAGNGLGMASLALQVGQCMIVLKTFWDAVKDAPEDIRHLIEEIETLSLVLSDFKTSEQPEFAPGNEASSRCFQFCKKAVENLNAAVKEVEVHIKKRKRVGSVKAVLRRDVIEKLRDRLTTAQSMFMLSNNLYLVELQRRNRQAHYDWAKSTKKSFSSFESLSPNPQKLSCLPRASRNLTSFPNFQSQPVSKNELEHKCKKSRQHCKQGLRLRAQFLIPKWFFGVSRAIEIYESRAQAGWHFNIQVYNVVSRKSVIFAMVQHGDVAGIQHLFSTRQASPFDRSFNGWTLLDHAAHFQQLEICKLLKNEGADPNVSCSSSALMMACNSRRALLDGKRLFSLVQFLAQYVMLQDPFEDESAQEDWAAFYGDADTFSWILQTTNSTYQERSLEERVSFALNISRITPYCDIGRLVRAILTGVEIDERVCRTKDQWNMNLLHHLAWNLGLLVTKSISGKEARLVDSLGLIGDMVKGGSDLNAFTGSGETPMFRIIKGFSFGGGFTYHKYWNPTPEASLHMTLRRWLEQLKLAFVDLLKYGDAEKRQLESQGVFFNEWTCYESGRRWTGHEPKLRFINFTYGPNPDDWKFWIEPVMENYFIHFWEMIEHPERAMPGAWEEEYSDGDYDYDSDY